MLYRLLNKPIRRKGFIKQDSIHQARMPMESAVLLYNDRHGTKALRPKAREIPGGNGLLLPLFDQRDLCHCHYG